MNFVHKPKHAQTHKCTRIYTAMCLCTHSGMYTNYTHVQTYTHTPVELYRSVEPAL